MHRTGLALLLVLSACKSKSEPVEPKVEAKPSALLDVPTDTIWAASSHLRIVDAKAAQVVAGVDLSRSITSIVFTRDGQRAFVGASDGVREIDPEQHTLKAQLTRSPARQLSLSAEDDVLHVLEHDVIKLENGARELTPFRMTRIDLGKNAAVGSEEIGHRVLIALPALAPKLHHLVVMQSGEVRVGTGALAEGKKLEVTASFDGDKVFGFRPYAVRTKDGTKAYLPLEGQPSRIAEIDLEKGAHRTIELGGPALLRGLALSADERTLLVNGSTRLLRLELGTGKIDAVELGGAHLDLAVSNDGRRAYLALPVDGEAGALSVVRLDGLKLQGKIATPDISPWILAVRPHAAYAVR